MYARGAMQAVAPGPCARVGPRTGPRGGARARAFDRPDPHWERERRLLPAHRRHEGTWLFEPGVRRSEAPLNRVSELDVFIRKVLASMSEVTYRTTLRQRAATASAKTILI